MRCFPCLCIPVLLALACAMPLMAADRPSRVILLLESEAPTPWNTLLKTGLERAGREFGIATGVVVASAKEEQQAAFRAAAGDADMVIVGTDRFHEILRDNAGNFRRIMFGCIDAGIRGPNIMCVTFADEQAAFLAGAAAAMLTTRTELPGINESAIIGWISGEDVPATRSLFNGFSEGARLVEPKIRVIHAITGSFAEKDGAAREARRLLDEGADVIALAAGAGNAAAMEKIRAANAYVVALDTDQAADYPGHVLTSIVKKADLAVYGIVAAAAKNAFKGKNIQIHDLESRGVDIVDPQKSMGAAGRGLNDMARRIGELRREIVNRGIRIKSLRARTLCDCL